MKVITKVKVELNQDTSGNYTWVFKPKGSYSKYTVDNDMTLQILIAHKAAAMFELKAGKLEVDTKELNLFSNTSFSAGTSTLSVAGAPSGASGAKIRVTLSQQSTLPVSISVADKSGRLTPSFQLERQILGMYQKHKHFYILPENSIKFDISSDQTQTYELEANAVSWRAHHPKPYWLGYTPNKAGSAVVLKDQNPPDTGHLSAKFNLNIKSKIDNEVCIADPTVVNRSSMTHM